MKRKLLPVSFWLWACSAAFSQHLNLGITFQYLILKQVRVNSDHIIPYTSYNYYKVTDNRWKFFSAGQSFVIGAVAQLDIKKFYFGIEPSGELNSYDYTVEYPLTSTKSEMVSFKTVFNQINLPVYLGYQFKTSDFLRYSFYAGAGPVFPLHFEASVRNESKDPAVGDRYYWKDMDGILYTTHSYWNAVAGLGIHFASLGRFDIRYVNRLGSPGSQYSTSIRSVGIGLTFFLPLHLLKKKIYYEE